MLMMLMLLMLHAALVLVLTLVLAMADDQMSKTSATKLFALTDKSLSSSSLEHSGIIVKVGTFGYLRLSLKSVAV